MVLRRYWQQSKALGEDNGLTIRRELFLDGQVIIVALKEPVASLTPIFVSQAIRYGLSVGWEPRTPRKELKIVYQGDLLRFFHAL